MNELKIINTGGIDCYEKDGTVYLKLEAVSRGLGFVYNRNGIEYVRWNTIRQHLSQIGFSQEVAKDGFIPENTFYRLAMKAKNATAEKFQAFVADEVIPAIRKTGCYSIIPKDYPSTLRAYATEVEKNMKLIEENETQRKLIKAYDEKIKYCSKTMQSKDGTTITQIAKRYGISSQKLNKILERIGIQHREGRQWVLNEEYADYGYTKLSAVSFTKWTDIGVAFLDDILMEFGISAKTNR